MKKPATPKDGRPRRSVLTVRQLLPTTSADTQGMSTVHVNRVLRALKKDGMTVMLASSGTWTRATVVVCRGTPEEANGLFPIFNVLPERKPLVCG
jgi:hypothetical protein